MRKPTGPKRPGRAGPARDRKAGPRPSRPKAKAEDNPRAAPRGEAPAGGRPGRPPRSAARPAPAAVAEGPRGRIRAPGPAPSPYRPDPDDAAHDGPASPPPAAAAEPTKVQTVTVSADEAGMRVDRFLEARFPGLSFSHIQRVVRKGELRVDGGRVETKDRLEAGQKVRIPPLSLAPPTDRPRASDADMETRQFLKGITLYEDDDVLVFDKPMGLAVQGGSGMRRHMDGLLTALTDAKGQKPRLVHRLDKDTSGCLVVAKTRYAAAALAKSFRSRDTRKTYWALVAGVPRVKQGRVSTYLARDEDEEAEGRMKVARHGDEGASHAVTYYAVVETAAQKLAWLSLKPVTGRTHQLRAHTAHIGHAIIGDPKYFKVENWELPGGIQNRLHLMARRIVIPHPRGGKPIDVTAPLPPHMQQSWNLLGFEVGRFDPIVDAPEE